MENQSSTQNRPLFLTIVCIICFVGLGFTLISSISTLALSTAGAPMYTTIVEHNIQLAMDDVRANNPEAATFVEHIFNAVLTLVERLPVFAAILLLCAIIALTGVFLMWNLKKMGFYLYTAASVILILIPGILIGYNLVSLIISIPLFMNAALFITLFALNFNAMK